MLGIMSFAFMTQIGCARLQLYGKKNLNDLETIRFNNLSCNTNCGCSSTQYEPICSADGKTVLFSPCQAGCKDVEELIVNHGDRNETIKRYLDCACVVSSANETRNGISDPWPTQWPKMHDLPSATLKTFHNYEQTLNYAFDGYCPSDDCSKQFYILMGMALTIGLIASTSRLPNFLIFLRAIDQKDKAAAITLTISFISAFALLPSPLIFGGLYDGACTIWAESCGERLNCLAYNTDKLRVEICTLAAVFLSLSLCCDAVVFYYVKWLELYDEDANEEENHEKAPKTVACTNNDETSWINLEKNPQKLYTNSI
jgi:hypothetical protein